MAQFELWQKNDLKKPIQVQAVHGVVFTQDSKANLFGVEVTNGGAAASLSGTVQGFVIRGDGYSIPLVLG